MHSIKATNQSTTLSSTQLKKLKNSSQFCRTCSNKYHEIISTSQYADPYAQVDVNKILLDAKQLISQKQYENAESILEQLYKAEIYHADVLYLLGDVKRILGKYKEAEQYLYYSMEFKVHSYLVYNSLGLTLMQLEQYQKALEFFNLFLQYKPDTHETFFDIARCQVKLKQFESAAQNFSKAIELSNSLNGWYFLHRADCYEALGFSALAASDYRTFKLIEPDYKNFYLNQIQKLAELELNAQAQSVKNFFLKLQSL